MKTGIKLLTTIDGPIAAHRNKHAALRLQNAGGGMCHPVWAGWWGLLKPDLRPPVLCKFLQSPVKEEESDSQNLDEILLLPVNAFEERN
jgi:hypothetical protein